MAAACCCDPMRSMKVSDSTQIVADMLLLHELQLVAYTLILCFLHCIWSSDRLRIELRAASSFLTLSLSACDSDCQATEAQKAD